MKTLILKVRKNLDKEIKIASNIIDNGGLVAFPTETVYGLGASAYNEKAIKKIFEVKGRPLDNPLIVHISNLNQINEITNCLNENARKIIDKFWPGPITIILKKSSKVPDIVSAGLDSVAIRMPKNKIALSLIEKSGPIVAPSANISGKPSPTNASHVIDDLNGKIDCIIAGGNVNVGIESTIIDLTEEPTILRPGKITPKQIEKIIGKVKISKGDEKVVKAPGMKYKHYSPNAKVILVYSKDVSDLIKKYKDKKIATIGFESELSFNGGLNSLNKNLFRLFREFDKQGVEIILVKAFPERGLGLAFMNRVKKASSEVFR